VARDAAATEIEAAAAAAGMCSLWADGIAKVVAGLTTIDELHRILI
jgi:type II secretory ATPase GspE/PulE/Tfp pilus assembly ATPase PilB-like protein